MQCTMEPIWLKKREHKRIFLYATILREISRCEIDQLWEHDPHIPVFKEEYTGNQVMTLWIADEVKCMQ